MIYLISRDVRFSPHSESRDEAIFKAVALRIAMEGLPISTLDENRLPDILPEARLILSMARSREALTKLSALETRGIAVWNSPSALLNNGRAEIDRRFGEAGFGAPFLRRAADPAHIRQTLGFPLWLKRSDASAQSAGDVRFIEDEEQLREALADFRARGIDDFMLSAHLEGDLIKFYGVEGTPFFSHTYPTRNGGFSKFGLERHNGAPSGHPFSVQALKTAADAAAHHFGMPVYGGDAIVRADGRFFIIDFNDWPSFGSCTDAAATAITARTLAFLKSRA